MDENENRKNIEGLESMISPSTLLLEREEVQFELQLVGLGLDAGCASFYAVWPFCLCLIHVIGCLNL